MSILQHSARAMIPAAAIGAAMAISGSAASGAATFLGPTPYLCQGDSPFPLASTGWYLETFEDGLFNVPGVTANPGSVITGGITDSVDCDDGVIDGVGVAGHSFFGNGPTGFTFTFDATVLHGLPTSAGIVWTDAGVGSTTTFEAFDAANVSLGTIGPVAVGDNNNGSGTAEDRFFGVTNATGIKSIKIKVSGGGIEVDHLQYGPVFPCIADIAPPGGDGIVNIDDLLAVINAWGAAGSNPADINHNNIVNIDDLLAVIGAWGPCS